MNFISSLNKRDRKYIWHPFTQHGIEKDFLPVKAAQGAWLILEDNQKILDAIASWGATLHGHAHPVIAEAIYKQSKELEHVMFAGFTHEPAVQLAETLIQAVQERGTTLSRCFYADNGATAVEAAIKIAYQYHKVQGKNNRTRFLALSNAYHGDTIGSMAVSARESYHHYFAALLPEVDFVSDAESLKKILSENPDTYAAFIIEPMVQAANGMIMHSAEFLADIARACKKADVLLICDEVYTGFYRTGKCFAFEYAHIQPDFLCLAKGLTGGFLPLSATLVTEKIFEAFYSEKIKDAFLHGHTFTGNPIGCAAALASWKLLHESDTQSALERIQTHSQQWIYHLSKHERGENARILGTIGAVDMKNYPEFLSETVYKIRRFALEKGVLIRPFGQALYAVPPYCVTASEIDKIYETIILILDNMEKFK